MQEKLTPKEKIEVGIMAFGLLRSLYLSFKDWNQKRKEKKNAKNS